MYLLIQCSEEHRESHTWYFCPQNTHHQNQIMRNIQTDQNWRTMCKINVLLLFKESSSWKIRKPKVLFYFKWWKKEREREREIGRERRRKEGEKEEKRGEKKKEIKKRKREGGKNIWQLNALNNYGLVQDQIIFFF